MRLYLWTDGATSGNPGPSAIGGVAKTYDEKRKLIEVFHFYGRIPHGTNNIAEYEALLKGLSMAVEEGVTEITCYLDSELVVRQVNRQYQVREPSILERWLRVNKIVKQSGLKFEFNHIPRSQNKEADAFAHKGLGFEIGEGNDVFTGRMRSRG